MSITTEDQFQVFIDFIKNIDKYDATASELKKITIQYNEAAVALTKGQSLATWEAQIEAKKLRLEQQTQNSQDVLDTRSQELDKRNTDLDAFEERVSHLNKNQMQLRDEISQAYVDLNAKNGDLAKKESDLNVQIDKYNNLIQELESKIQRFNDIIK